MAGWGFDFARIPMSYWNWTPVDDWNRFNEDVLTDVDRAVEALRLHPWPGNLSELWRTVRRSLQSCQGRAIDAPCSRRHMARQNRAGCGVRHTGKSRIAI